MSKNKTIFILQGTDRAIIFFFVTFSMREHFQRLRRGTLQAIYSPGLADSPCACLAWPFQASCCSSKR